MQSDWEGERERERYSIIREGEIENRKELGKRDRAIYTLEKCNIKISSYSEPEKVKI